MKKRIVALLLCCVMLLTLSPSLIASASAEEETQTVATTEEPKAEEPKATEEPTDPEQPTTPEQPVDPDQPTTPEQPATPEKPKDEEQPTTPEEPAVPEAPTTPEEPTVPEEGEEENTESSISTVNFTDVAPFLAPVTGSTARRAATRAAADNSETPKDDGLKVSKTAEKTSDGYKITLEAYATGSKIVSEITRDVPTDIILVLDQSGSMEKCIGCGEDIERSGQTHRGYTYTQATNIDTSQTYYLKDGSQVNYCTGSHRNYGGTVSCNGGAGWYTSRNASDHTKTAQIPEKDLCTRQRVTEECSSRIAALKTAVTTFVNAVNTKAKGADGEYGGGDDINHRIAVVGFAAGEYSSYGAYYNTEVFIGSEQYKYGTGASSVYSTAFRNMNTAAGYADVIASKDALDAQGGTYTNLGLEMANGIFAANPIQGTEQRNRVVIVFTDGKPGRTDYDSAVANSAISEAATTKKAATAGGYGATVYTIGVFDGANGSNPASLPANNGNGNNHENRFMHLVSSNYPNATSMNSTGAVKDDLGGKSYYLSAGNANALNDIFEQISKEIEDGGSTSKLTDEAIVKDIISPQFTLPEGAKANDITLETYKCTGKDANDDYTWSKNNSTMGATASISGDQVNVTGFNFSENYVGTVTENGETTYRGHKLVISFTVQPKAGFLGGNDVFTNTSAGIYENKESDKPTKEFEKPTVNVEIKDVTVDAADKNVYLLGEVTADQLKTGATVKVGDVTLDLSKANYGLQDWQKEYVNITVTVKDEKGNDVTDKITDLRDDTTYTIKVTVSPTTDGKSSNGTAAVAKDATDTGKINVFKPEVTFKDSEITLGEEANYADNYVNVEWKRGTTPAPAAMGTAPTLAYTYDRAAGAFQQDTPVKVSTVTINDTDVTSHVTFYREKCIIKTDCNDALAKVTDDVNFIVHVKSLSLEIRKTYNNMLDPNQSAVFEVSGPTGKFEVVIHGTGSVTINGLPIGNYTVTEKNTWTWRYQDTAAKTVTLTKDDTTKTVSFENKTPTPYWLTGGAYCDNNWKTGNSIKSN